MRKMMFLAVMTVCVMEVDQTICMAVGPPAPQDRGSGGSADEAPAPNIPDEPVAPAFSARKAREFLDQVSLAWTRERKCGSCHTNYAYMLASSSLGSTPTPAMTEIHKFFEERAANWDSEKPRWDTEVVATAVTLAIRDANQGTLSPVTRSALDRMWTLQQENGVWNWLKCDWPPLESDDYYGAVFAALGVGIAPDRYAETPAAKAGMHKVRQYLQETPPPNLHHKAILMWASIKMPELMSKVDRHATLAELLERQRADGGWNLPSLGDWNRRDGSPNDQANAASDGYATGLVVYVLRQAGLPPSHEAIRRGVTWLKSNQRQSGRWYTRSVNNDKYHFISHAGSAYAVMALRACDEFSSE